MENQKNTRRNREILEVEEGGIVIISSQLNSKEKKE